MMSLQEGVIVVKETTFTARLTLSTLSPCITHPESFEATRILGHHYLSRTSKTTNTSHAFLQLVHNLYFRRIYLRRRSAIASSNDIPSSPGLPFQSPTAQFDRLP